MQANLSASRHTIRYLCSATEDPGHYNAWCGDELAAFCASHGIALTWQPGPASLGKGMNGGSRVAETPIFVLFQDDFEVIEPLDLSPGIELMESHPEVDILRYGYPPENFGWKRLPHQSGLMRFSLKHQWFYGDEPQMRRKNGPEKFGWYDESINYRSERNMSISLKNNGATILAADKPYVSHIGSTCTTPQHLKRLMRPHNH